MSIVSAGIDFDGISGCKHTLLSAGLLDLCASTDANQTVEGLELLQGLLGVVDESEASALTTTVLGTETEDGDLVLVGLVQVGELVAELVLGDVGAVGVEDIPVGKKNQSSACRYSLAGLSQIHVVCPICPNFNIRY